MAKKLVKLTLFLALFLGLVIGVLLWNINPILEQLKPQISSAISKAIHQEVTLGKITARLFPSVAIEVHDVALAERAAKESDQASVQLLLLDTDLTALLRGKVSVSKLALKGGRFTLTRQADGRIMLGGIDLLGQGKKKTSDDDAPTTTPASGKQKSGTAADKKSSANTEKNDTSVSFELKNAELDDVNVVWVDKAVSPPQRIQLTGAHAELHGFDPTKDGKISLTASILGSAKDNLSVAGTLGLTKTSLGLPRADLRFTLESVDLVRLSQIIAAYGVKIEGLSLAENLSLSTTIKSDDQGLRVSPRVDASAAQISLGTAFVKGKGIPLVLNAALQPSLQGSVQGNAVSLTLGNSQIEAPFSFDPKTGSQFRLETKKFPLDQLARLLPAARPYHLSGAIASKLQISLPVSTSPKKKSLPIVNGTVQLKKIGTTITFPQADGKAPPASLVISGATGKVLLDRDKATVEKITLNLAKQRLTLDASVAPLWDPRVEFSLHSKKFALGPVISSFKPGGVPQLNKSVVHDLRLKGAFSKPSRKGQASLKLGKSKIADIHVASALFNAKFTLDRNNRPRTAELAPSTIRAFSGRIGMFANLNANQTLSFTLKGSKLDLRRISGVAMPNSKYPLSGTVESLKTSLTAQTDHLVPTLKGPAELNVSKGAIHGINILKETLGNVDRLPGISGALTAYLPEKHRHMLKRNDTPFDSFVMLANIARETVILKKATLKHELYALSGQGKIRFSGDFAIHAQLKLGQALAQGMVLKEPKLKLLVDRRGNMVIPVVIERKGNRTLVIPDITDLAQRAAEATAREAAGRALDRVAPGLGGALDQLFK